MTSGSIANVSLEHQFVFAVNTITLVKSDALFSYVAPLNLLAWFLHPLRYFMDFRSFVRFNRTIIKITHLPLLLMIYIYERTYLSHSGADTVEIIAGRKPKAIDMSTPPGISPAARFKLRRDSVLTQQRDRVLDEVFKRPLRDVQTARDIEGRQKAAGTVISWISGMSASPPMQTIGEGSGLLSKKPDGRGYGAVGRQRPSLTPRKLTDLSGQSIRSDPEQFITTKGLISDRDIQSRSRRRPQTKSDNDDDGDDELFTNDEEEPPDEDIPDSSPRDTGIVLSDSATHSNRVRVISPDSIRNPTRHPLSQSQNLIRRSTNNTIRSNNFAAAAPTKLERDDSDEQMTVRYRSATAPASRASSSQSSRKSSPKTEQPSRSKIGSGAVTPIRASLLTKTRGSYRQYPTATASSSNAATPRRRPSLPTRGGGLASAAAWQSAPNFAAILQANKSRRKRQQHQQRSEKAMSDVVQFDAEDNDDDVASYASFQTKMAMATGGNNGGDDGRLGRLLLARIGAMEEGFRDVARELKELKKDKGKGKMSPGLWMGSGTGGGGSTLNSGQDSAGQ